MNIQNGLPSPDVAVTLQRHEGGNWVQLSEAVTNGQGRISALYPEGEALVDGTYRVVFETGDWFESQGTESFFPEIPVVFTMDAELDHYHVPLLLSPFGYSTYRGN